MFIFVKALGVTFTAPPDAGKKDFLIQILWVLQIGVLARKCNKRRASPTVVL